MSAARIDVVGANVEVGVTEDGNEVTDTFAVSELISTDAGNPLVLGR